MISVKAIKSIERVSLERVGPWWSRWKPTVHYLMETEAHVYALAIAASTLLAFYPFLMVMISLCRDVLHWRAAEEAIKLAVSDAFGGSQGEFIVRNIYEWGVPKMHKTSMVLLLFVANGIFEPMEVALNRAWGVTTNRSYLKNQIVSLGLIFACGGLAVFSLMLTALNSQWLPENGGFIVNWLELLFFKLAAVPVSIFALFLIYWLLPNRKINPRRVAPVAIIVGLALEGFKYLNIIFGPMLEAKLKREYQVFQHSAAILILSFLSSLIILAGAHWTANHTQEDPLS